MNSMHYEGPALTPLQSAVNHGILYVPPAYYQTSGDTTFALTSANHSVAMRFIAGVDFDPTGKGLSWYMTAISAGGNVALGVYDDAVGYEPNGTLNESAPVQPTMSANNAPSGYVVGLWDKNAANAEASGTYAAWKAMDGSASTDARSNAAPSGTDPIYYTVTFPTAVKINRVRIKSSGDAYPSDGTVWISNAGTMPAVNSDTGWTQIGTFSSVTDPGANGAREVNCTNSADHLHLRITITGRTGSSAYVAPRDIELKSAFKTPVPGALLHSYGNDDTTGASADTWRRKTLDSYQFIRNKAYWIRLTGSASLNVSASLRRWNETNGSMFPANTVTMTTTDGGTTWTQAQQNSKPSMLNMILGSTTHNCPHLVFGRQDGQYLFLPGDGITQIPQAGAWLDCEALSVAKEVGDTPYNIFAYLSSGALAIEASTTTWVDTDGCEVKSGATNRRRVGIIGPINIVSTYQGPVDVADMSLIAYHGMERLIGKSCPYYTDTQDTVPDFTYGWRRWKGNDDYRVRILVIGTARTFLTTDCLEYGYLVHTISVNGQVRERDGFSSRRSNTWISSGSSISASLCEGFHTFIPMSRTSMTGSSGVYLNLWWDDASTGTSRAQIRGELECA